MVDANAIRHATVKYGTAERLVAVRTREGQTNERVFTSLDAVARFMRERVHLTRYDINDANFQPGTKRVTRPDTAFRLKDAHAALSHTDWLEKKSVPHALT